MNKEINFIKMQGLGNDFILIDRSNQNINLESKHIKFLCNRKFGIGCDQLLIIEKSAEPLIDFNYQIFNQNGIEAEHCANGARCVIKYLAHSKLITNNLITLKTKNRIISGFVLEDGNIKLGLGHPNFAPEKIPFIHKSNPNNKYSLSINCVNIEFAIVSMGNPHAVIQVKDKSLLSSNEYLSNIAILLQESEYFPESVNVNFYYIENSSQILLKTYERNCGFTLSCGTGAAATVCNAIHQKLLEKNVDVVMQGGILTLEWSNEEIFMIGDAVEVYRGIINYNSIKYGVTELHNFEKRLIS